MPRIAVLDANAYLGLEGGDAPDLVLAEISRLVMQGKLSLYITPELPTELKRDKDIRRQKRQIAHLEKFPEIPQTNPARVESIARELSEILFLNVTSSKRVANRLSDCLHLAHAIEFGSHYFITSDRIILKHKEDIWQRHFIKVTTPNNIVNDIKMEPVSSDHELPLSMPTLLINRAEPKHRTSIRTMLEELKNDYPDFLERWLPEQFFNNERVNIKISTMDDDVRAVSITKPKDKGIIKLATFFVHPDYRHLGLGQHLMHHELISWAKGGIHKAYVTVPLHKKDLIRFFSRYGFSVEGVCPLRYSERTEIVMGRYLFNKTVLESGWTEFVEWYLKSVLLCDKINEQGTEYWLPAFGSSELIIPLHKRSLVLEEFFNDKGALIRLIDTDTGLSVKDWDTSQLESDFFPLQLDFPKRNAAIVPIKKKWAELLFEFERDQRVLFENQGKVRLRSDNVYYRVGTEHGNLQRGTPIIFYITDPVKKAVATAKAFSVEIGKPAEIAAKYSPLGVFGKEEIENVAKNGLVQAIRFDYLEPFENPVTLKKIQKLIPNIQLQTSVQIPFEKYLELRKLGGLKYVTQQ